MLTLGINYSQMHDSSACIVRDDDPHKLPEQPEHLYLTAIKSAPDE